MTKQEYQIKYAEIMEHLQRIEINIKKLCGNIMAKDSEDFFKAFQESEDYNLGYAIKEFRKLQAESNLSVFTEDDFTLLEEVRQKRNYWCHNSFDDIKLTLGKNTMVKYPRNEAKINDDWRFAEETDYYFRDKFDELVGCLRDNN